MIYFCIADTFIGSLARLNGEQQTVAKTTAFDLQRNPANVGMQFRKPDKAKDKKFWSVRVSGDNAYAIVRWFFDIDGNEDY